MFGIGMSEILLILVIALIVLGPQKLPEVAKALGKAVNEFKRALNEVKESLEEDSSLKEVKKTFTGMNRVSKSNETPTAQEHIISNTETPLKSQPEESVQEDFEKNNHASN